MDEREVRTALSIISDMPRPQQFDLAWKCLTEANNGIRANAKCWLTYRAIEGTVLFEDWLRHVETVPIPDLRQHPRWFVSLQTGIIYLTTLQRSIREVYTVINEVLMFDLINCPGMLLNHMRVAAIMANHQFIEGSHGSCVATVRDAIATWQRTVSDMDLMKTPSWVADNGFDMAPLHCLLRIASRLEMTAVPIANEHWIDHLLKNQKQLPWWKCIEKLSRGKTIW